MRSGIFWPTIRVRSKSEIQLPIHPRLAVQTHSAERRPRSHSLTGPHTLGCLSRTGLQFKLDNGAPAEHQAKLKDYTRSGYQLGHMAPNQDFAWDQGEQRDSFSFVNVAPQLGSLNAQGWERGEEYVRAWALARRDVEVYVGSIVRRADKKRGTSAVDIPKFFYKVVIDPNAGEGFGIIMA